MKPENNVSFVKITLDGNALELSGTEEFIDNNVEKLINIIRGQNSSEKKAEKENYEEKKETETESTLDKYKRVIDYDCKNDSLHIMGKVPGNNKADKIKNIALITIYVKQRDVAGSELVEECKTQTCYDPKNFSAIFARDTINFIKNGKGQSWSLRLTVNGKEEAIKVLDVMLNERTNN